MIFEADEISYRVPGRRGPRILDRVSFRGRGVVCLLGPNGSGKTTLLRLAATVQTMQQGSFRFGEQQLGADTDDAALTGWRHNVSYLPQHFPVLDRYTVGEYLTYLAWLRGAKPTAIEQDLLPTLREVGLEGQITAHVGVLSGGMRQRLGIAQAMIGKPSLILLDEPTTGLDPRERRRFRALVESRKNEATIMMSTHLVEDAVKLADSIVVMRSGTVLHSGPPSTLLAAGDEVTADSVEVAYDRLQGIGTGAQALT